MEEEGEEGEARPTAMSNQRVVGEYELQRMVGKGSFAKVFRAAHRRTGARVAVKEIDRELVDERVRKSILQEREILNSIDHPNILRLLDNIDTRNMLYLVLEYCDGGDLDAFLNKHGRLPEATAKDLMRQLAEGLKVLRERNIVHRDLKPQNLLLSTNGDAIILKIGDFGFARSLMHENLAATICGSPLYMAPEIWQGKDYDAKSDLWSVGVILFQLVTGKLPFLGNNYYQLRQNILASDELNFPSETEADLCPDCIDLCRRLLCRDPKRRISFEEFFNHKFLVTARKHEPISESHHGVDLRDACQTTTSSVVLKANSGSVDSKNMKIFDSWEWIEREYVLVPLNCTSMEMSSLEKSVKDDTVTRTAGYDRTSGKGSVQNQNRDFIHRAIAVQNHGCALVSIPHESTTTEDRRAKPPDYTRLHILNQYVAVLTELAREKLFKGLDLQALSIELVLLAIWKEALDACSLFMDAADDRKFSKSAQENVFPKNDRPSLNVARGLDFTRSVSVCSWVESGFMKAYDRAEKISHRLRENDDNTKMPDAMDIIFQTALDYGKSGAANEILGHQSRSMALYSKAIILLTFISHEAPMLPLKPPFSLSPSNQQRIHRYITNLKSHLCSAQVAGQQQRSVQN